MKFIKIGLYIIGGLLMVGIVAAGIFVATFDANNYKPQISEQVKLHTGRDVILGDIKPAVFPWLGIELQQLTLSNAEGFKAQHMLQIEKLDVRVAIMPLLTGEVRIDTLRVHGLQLSLAKDEQGNTNWDDILQKQQGSTDASAVGESPSVASPEEAVSPLAALMVNGIEIKDANINWHDAATKQSVALQKLNLETGAIRAGQSLPVTMSLFIESSEPKAAVEMSLKTQLNFDAKLQLIKLADLELSIDAAMKELGVELAQLKLRSALEADLKHQVYKLPEIDLQINASGQAIPGGNIKAKIKSAAQVDLQKQTASIEPLNVDALDLKVQSKITLTQLLESPSVQGELKLLAFNPKKLLNQLEVELPKMQSAQVLKSSEIAFEFIGNQQSVNIKNLAIKLDKSYIAGSLAVTQLDNPAIQYQLSLDKINLDDYLPPSVPEEQKAGDSSTHQGSASGPVIADTPIELPVKMLRDLNVNGSFKAQSIQVSGQTISSLLVETRARGGLVKLPLIKAKLLDGNVNLSAQLDVRKNTPAYQLAMKARALEADSIVSPIIKDVLGEKDARLTGASNLDLDINSKGQSVKQLMASSNGQFKYTMGKAELHNVDINFNVRKALADFMREKKLPVNDNFRGKYNPKQTTAFKIVRASGTIKNGLVDNKDLLLESSKIKITGAGQVSLPKENINYRVVLDIVQDSRNSVGQRLIDEPLPVLIKGSFASPDYDIKTSGWSRVLKNEAKQAVKKKTDKKVDEIKDKFKDKYRDKLKGLFR